MAQMHEVDYELFGDAMQYVELELDPGEAALAEAGGLMYMDDGVGMETIFGDGSRPSSGFLDALVGAGKRLLTGESLFMTAFMNQGQSKKKLAFAAPYPGKIIPVHLREIGGELIAQKDSFLCAAKGVSLGHRVPEEARRRVLRRRGFHHAAASGGRLVLPERGRQHPRARAGAGRAHPRRHRLHRRVRAGDLLRHRGA